VKKAILNVADQGPLESLVIMLRAVGYSCFLPSARLRDQLRQLGCDTVLDIDHLVNTMGYERPFSLPETGGISKGDLLVDVKAHRNAPKIWKRWDDLDILWYRINGGQPEHVINARGDFGDEINPPCPVLTPNQWYRCDCEEGVVINKSRPETCPWCKGKAYTCWPPFARFGDYTGRYDGKGYGGHYTGPVCLIHNIQGWGYRELFDGLRGLGVKLYGAGSPDGLIDHKSVPSLLSSAVALVHPKSQDAPGYALYEAMAAGCPVICTGRLIWRCKMQDLLVPNETCLTFDNRETHDGLTPEQVEKDIADIRWYLETLADPVLNHKIGQAGRRRLREIMWSPERKEDVNSLQEFMERHFQ
jgi:hypothetical protein